MSTTTHELQQSIKAVREGQHASRALEQLFASLRPSSAAAAELRLAFYNAIRFADQPGVLSVPGWLRVRLEQSLGNRYAAFLASSAADAPVVVRVNTLRTTTANCLHALAPYQPVPLDTIAIEIRKPFGLFSSAAFHQGWFEQQDITSQRIAESTHVLPGMRVVDSCAGAGGKSLAMAAMMQNRGKIIALDIAAQKLDACKQRAKRAGASCIETRHITSTKVVKRLHASADCVLIDAPCSGTGVLRRNPDILWHLTEAALDELLTTQAHILHHHAKMVKPGGRLVYATCSVLHEEGPKQVTDFLASHPEFSLSSSWQTMPGENGGDGFYAAILQHQ